MKVSVTNLSPQKTIEPYFTGGDIVWSKNGRYLYATCSNVVKQIDLTANLATSEIGDSEMDPRISALCLDDERNRLVVAYIGGLLREYNLPDEEKGTTISLERAWKTMHTSAIQVLKYSSDFSYLATGSTDHTVMVWNMKAKVCMQRMKGNSVVSAIEFTKANSQALIGYMDGSVRLYDVKSGSEEKLVHEWTAHQSRITSIFVLVKTKQAIFVSRDQSFSIIDLKTKNVQRTLPLFEAVESALISPNGELIVAGDSGTLKQFTVDGAKKIKEKALIDHGLVSVLYSEARNEILAVSAEENLYILDFDTFKVRQQIVGFHDEIFGLAIVSPSKEPDAPKHLVVAANSNPLRLYDMTTWNCQLLPGHTDSVVCVRTAPFDHHYVASSSKDKTWILWKLVTNHTTEDHDSITTLRPLALATGHVNTVAGVCFSHSAKRKFVLTASYDTTLKLWSISQVISSAKLVDKVEDAEKLSCNSTIVAHQKDITCVDCSPDDSMCLTGSADKSVKLWKIDTNKMQLGIEGKLEGHRRGIWDAKFSPNGLKIVSCSTDAFLKVWSVADKSCLQTISGHTFPVLKVEWINGGTQLISADGGGVMKLWTLENAVCEASFDKHSERIWALTPAVDESEYVSAAADSKIIVWKDVSVEQKEEEEKERRRKVNEEQTLNNLLGQGRFLDALDYALGLARPHAAHKVINELIERDELLLAIGKLDNAKLLTLLDFTTQWNTNSRTANAAQHVLRCLLLLKTPEELLKLPRIAETVQALLPYTVRHVERLNKARQDISLLDFTWAQMRLAN